MDHQRTDHVVKVLIGKRQATREVGLLQHGATLQPSAGKGQHLRRRVDSHHLGTPPHQLFSVEARTTTHVEYATARHIADQVQHGGTVVVCVVCPIDGMLFELRGDAVVGSVHHDMMHPLSGSIRRAAQRSACPEPAAPQDCGRVPLARTAAIGGHWPVADIDNLVTADSKQMRVRGSAIDARGGAGSASF